MSTDRKWIRTRADERISIRDLGEDHSVRDWLDYASTLPPEEYRESHLLPLVDDPAKFPDAEFLAAEFPDAAVVDGPLLWVPSHAWRALAQLGCPAVLEPMMRLKREDDGDGYGQEVFNDFELVCERIGDGVAEPLVAVLADRDRIESDRILAARGLGADGRRATGSTRAHIVGALLESIRQVEGTADWVSDTAAEALLAIGDRSARPELLSLYGSWRLHRYSADFARYFGWPPGVDPGRSCP